MKRRRLLALAAGAWPVTGPAQGAARWVLGQTLPLSGPAFPQANRVLAGARAQVERLNAAGGIGGRPLELVTLDDGGDPRRSADNVRELARRGALAVLNCLGESACIAAADAARWAGLLLVGPMSGAAALRQPAWPHVYTLQPDDAREAQALLRQLRAIGITRLVHLADGYEAGRERVLAAALQADGVALRRAAPAGPAGIEAALREAVAAGAPAWLLTLGPETLDALGRVPPAALEGLPPMVLALSGPGLTQLTRLLRGRAMGFTSVVPNPEASQLPLVREFERDVDTLGSPEAISFEGLAAYLAVRLCADALRRLPVRAEPAALGGAIESLGRYSPGGFPLVFGPGRHHGSDFVEVGVRSRDGRTRH